MITPEEIQKKAERKFPDFLKWKATEILGIENEPFFPLEIKSDKGKAGGDLAERGKEIAPLIAKSKQKTGRGYELEFEEVNTRRNGRQTQIKSIKFTSEDDFLFTAKKKTEAENFKNALLVLKNGLLRNSQNLFFWSVHHLSDLTSSREKNFWQDICLCVNFLAQNPDTHKYIRELPVKVHTKFIENNKSLIHSLVELLQNDDDENARHSERSAQHDAKLSFEKAHGLKEKPVLARFRPLCKNPESDENPLRISGFPLSEISLSLEDFCALGKTKAFSSFQKIFVVENEMVFLTFPPVENSLCVWGHGFTAVELKNASWLSEHGLFYFGDLDEHGFLILSDFRKYFPAAKSFCMDKATLAEFSDFRVEGKTLAGNSVPENLTAEEKEVFEILRSDKKKNRLEQERISNNWIETKIEKLEDE